jgi:mannosyltransferase OCH1-like enzyme
MKANEVRVGNWYDQFGNYHQFTGSIIRDLEKAPETQIWCKPIPLTEEWLLRFGFNQSNYELYCERHEEMELRNRYNKFFIEIEEEENMNFVLAIGDEKIDFEFVHQLQNIYFALTGEELELKE